MWTIGHTYLTTHKLLYFFVRVRTLPPVIDYHSLSWLCLPLSQLNDSGDINSDAGVILSRQFKWYVTDVSNASDRQG